MEIAKITLKNHPILQNITLNFCDTKGVPYKNIVFTGENGTGKTALLDLLNKISGHIRHFLIYKPSYDLTVEFRITELELQFVKETFRISDRDMINEHNNTFALEYTAPNKEHPNGKHLYYLSGQMIADTHSTQVEKCFNSIYSESETSYQTQEITSVTSSQVDVAEDFKSQNSGVELAMKLKQLLVDINTQDAEDLQQWCDENPTKIPDTYKKHEKLSRFSNSFNTMLENIKFTGISTKANQKNVVFQKHDKDVLLEQLSSGEKQIVFRSGNLLKNIAISQGLVVLIDEPEISMHPRWQRKIFSFYTSLFKNDSHTQIAQIFFATHSEYVLKDALQNGAQIIILKDENNTITPIPVTKFNTLPFSPTYAEIKYKAFNIPTIEFHDELYGYIYERFAQNNIKTLEDFFVQNGALLNKEWAKPNKDSFNPPEKTTLMTYIRHYYHHPETVRRLNNPLSPLQEPTEDELRESIEKMLDIIRLN